MPKVKFSRTCKSDVLKAHKTLARAQEKIRALDLEGTEEFTQRVVVKRNPAIAKARSQKIAYTIAREDCIIEVHGGDERKIGVVQKKDIHIPKGTIYTIAKN